MHISRPAPATAIASLALFVALGGPSEAAKTLGLKPNSVTSATIKNGSIATADLASATIRTLKVPRGNSVNSGSVRDGSLTGVDIRPGSLGGDRLAANAIGSAQVANNSLGTEDIADGAIDSQELRDGSIAGRDLAEGTVGTREVSALAGQDVAEYAGILEGLDFGTIPVGDCRSVTSTALTGLRPSLDLRDDVILVTPRSAFPSAGVALTAKAPSANQIEVTICNVDGPTGLVLGTETFRYLAIDTSVR